MDHVSNFNRRVEKKICKTQNMQCVLARKDDMCDVSLLKNYLADGGETAKPVRPSSNFG